MKTEKTLTLPNKSSDAAPAKNAEQAAAEIKLETIVEKAEPISEPENFDLPPIDEGPGADELQAVGIATIVVNFGAQAAGMKWPCTMPLLNEQTKAEGVRVLAPVLAKYGVKSELLEKYKEEFALLTFAAGLGFGMYQAILADAEVKARRAAEKDVEKV